MISFIWEIIFFKYPSRLPFQFFSVFLRHEGIPPPGRGKWMMEQVIKNYLMKQKVIVSKTKIPRKRLSVDMWQIQAMRNVANIPLLYVILLALIEFTSQLNFLQGRGKFVSPYIFVRSTTLYLNLITSL